MDKSMVARNFSRYAHLYDGYSVIQNKSSRKLLEYVPGSDFRNILEIGCGTGNLTLSLREKFRDARIKAFDISGKMVEIAEKKLKGGRVEFSVADAEKLTCLGKFDLVISHGCFQWLSNLDEVLRGYEKLLSKNGFIVFSAFGPLTFRELNVSLKSILKKPDIQADSFSNKRILLSALNVYFKRVCVGEARYTEYFPALRDLLRKIKYSGIRGNGIGAGARINRGVLAELENTYLDKFGRIRATYQVFFCRGQKKEGKNG